jgi:short-subunit dehydrogenase
VRALTLREEILLLEWLRAQAAKRPPWMSVLMLFCAYMAFVYVPWDLLVKPAAADEEVWFGVRFHGTAAKWLAVPHWAVYAAGCLGFWRMKAWMWPWAAVYAGQVALSMLVWPILYGEGAARFALGLVFGGLFLIPTLALWRARALFEAPPERLDKRYGGWALVTGASAGIGAAFARELAAQGMPCVLVARREGELWALARSLETSFGVETRVVVADLTREAEMERVLREVTDLEIGVLVNNAGVGYAGRFDLQDTARLADLVKLNCLAPAVLTSGVLAGMRRRGRGAVLFLGSVAGSQPLPLHALYAASKAFDNLLGEALWAELAGSGIDVLSVLPGSTRTEFSRRADQLEHAGATAESVVADSIEALGHQPSVICGWWNWVRANAGARLLPRSTLTIAAGKVMQTYSPNRDE